MTGASGGSPGTPSDGPPPPVIDKAKRDKMRELIWKAFGEPAPTRAAPDKKRYVLPEHGDMWTGTEGVASDAEPGIEPEYVKLQRARAILLGRAEVRYGDALATNPKLEGEIDLWFVIVGDKNVGGIVESVDVLNKSTLRDPDVIECLRESFLGVTFPPPKGGGVVTVEYPISFSGGGRRRGGEALSRGGEPEGQSRSQRDATPYRSLSATSARELAADAAAASLAITATTSSRSTGFVRWT